MTVDQIDLLIRDWPHYLAAALLVLIRLSGLIAFAPPFNSAAISPRIKAGFAVSVSVMLAPWVTVVPGARAVPDMWGVLSELCVGLTFGITLAFLNEALQFAGTLMGMQFSFSLVNLLDPNSMIETPVLGQMLGWLGILVVIGAGLDRVLLAAVAHSFATVPVGTAILRATTATALSSMAAGIFLSGVQLASPLIAAALTVEVAISLVSRMAPQLPAMIVSIPLKTLICYVILIGSLALWPGWIERHYVALLQSAAHLVGVQ